MAVKAVSTLQIDAGFSTLKNLIIERTGHFYYQDKDDLLWERVQARFRKTGVSDCAQYIALLSDSISGSDEWVRLEAEITIGETFFFRYAEQFAALRRIILPEIVERKKAERRLRIWSAGCATGAEPYSIAILLKELLGEELQDWRINIIGTDINEGFLTAAREARFGQWALRSLSPEEKASYFLPLEGARWQLRPEFRTLVRFHRHNLLSLLDGTSPLQLTEFDLILCRNVLIYFHPDTVSRVVGALRDRLVEDGWMLLGHAEHNPVFSGMMQALSLPGTIAYCRRPPSDRPSPPVFGIPETAPLPLPDFPLPDVSLPHVPSQPPRKPDTGRVRRPAAAPARANDSAPPRGKPRAFLTEIREKADRGDLSAAEALCREAIAANSLDATLYLLQGLVLQALDRPAAAEEALRRSLYLDKGFAVAHYYLGLLLLAEGRLAHGRRALANAARIVATLPADRVLDEADGLTAGDLRELLRLHLETGSRNERKR